MEIRDVDGHDGNIMLASSRKAEGLVAAAPFEFFWIAAAPTLPDARYAGAGC